MWLSVSLRFIGLWVRLRGALVFHTLLKTSVEAAEIRKKRRLSLTCWVQAQLFAKVGGSTWVLTTLMNWTEVEVVGSSSLVPLKISLL